MGHYGGPLGPYGGPSGALRDSTGSYCTIFCPCKEHRPAKIIVFYYILHDVSSFYIKINKMHILARIFAPARITDRPK